MKLPAAKDISKEFAAVIREWLEPEELKEVDRLNAISSDGVCHTHDYCDANMAMLEAFTRLGVEEDAVVNAHADERLPDEKIMALWGEAWDLAVDTGFYDDGAKERG